MHPNSLGVRYKHLFPELKKHSRAEHVITEHNVHQPANPALRKIMDQLCAENMREDSEILNMHFAEEFLNQVKSGKRGIILMEHYSNFDLPGFIYLLEKQGEIGKEIAGKIIAMANMKLNEENPYVSAFAEGYSRIMIYPSRSLAAITDPEQHEKEEQRSRVINMASMRTLDRLRKEGNIVLVFPAGTRYRPGRPETKRGVREIDSYLRLSDVMLLVSINGNCLRFSEDTNNMIADITCEDKIRMSISPVYNCTEFRDAAKEWAGDSAEDKKQIVADYIMHRLELMHEENEKGRL